MAEGMRRNAGGTDLARWVLRLIVVVRNQCDTCPQQERDQNRRQVARAQGKSISVSEIHAA